MGGTDGAATITRIDYLGRDVGLKNWKGLRRWAVFRRPEINGRVFVCDVVDAGKLPGSDAIAFHGKR
jgi:hypothetical protein